MIGRLNTNSKDVTIIGAGYAGLISAYRLLNNGYSVTIHEASHKTGGLISSIHTPYGLVETAAHSIRGSSEILQLFSELNIPFVQALSKKKYIFCDGKIQENPLTLWDMFTAGCYGSFKKSKGQDLTLAEWTAQHVGPEAVGKAMAALAHGIYAAEPEELDQKLAFPRMTIPKDKTLVEKIFSSRTSKEKSFVMAPQKGMQDLIDRLTAFIQGHKNGQIIFGSEIKTLPDTSNIILATPAEITGRLIHHLHLENLRYAPMVTVTVFVNKNNIFNLPGIGVLNARGEDKKILGILFNSATFFNRAKKDQCLSFTIMLGGTSHPEILDLSDKEIQKIISSELTRILKLTGPLQYIHITRWPKAIPLYSSELRQILDDLETGWCADPGHIITGNYTGDVSIRGMCQSSLALVSH